MATRSPPPPPPASPPPEPPAQRSYRAPCPGCGAPVEFKSAQSAYAICPYCQSTVVRSGEVLSRIGTMGELFDDHSPLQLMASGRIALDGQAEQSFTLIGRLQYQSEAGIWSEWVAFLEDGTLATLGEDNGAYVFTRPLDAGRPLPDVERFQLGTTTAINGKPYSVAFSGPVHLRSAQGELPQLPPLGQPFGMVELRSSDGEVLSIDYSSDPPQAARGRAVQLDDLRLQGLKDESVKEEKEARQFSCPHCGAPVLVKLSSSKSITCPSCKSLIDLTSGVGQERLVAEQRAPVRPVIALGRRGTLQGVDWQVVGFQQRRGQEPGSGGKPAGRKLVQVNFSVFGPDEDGEQEDESEEAFEWSEYLLYHRQRGFAFLVDSDDGWSLVRPTTGAPQLASNQRSATYLGNTYALQSSYDATTTYVLGEFYWQVTRGQTTFNRDFANAQGLLSMEQSESEITWSSGDRLASAAVAKAFGLTDQAALLQRDDPGPFVAASGLGMGSVVLLVFVLIVVMAMMGNCSGSSGGAYRSSGGSMGGYTSGGGHK